MKKLFGIYILVLTLFFASCDKKGSSYDFAQILYPNAYGSLLYADQTIDTLRFATTYDWSLSVPAEWMSVNPDSMSGVVPEGYYMVYKVQVKFDTNKSDTVRTDFIFFNADGRSLASAYSQLHYMNIQRPRRTNYQFLLQDSARQERDSLVFRTYSNDWALTFKDGQPSWIILDADAKMSGRSGTYVVKYDLQPNETTEPREALLELRSADVVNKIKIRQTGLTKTTGNN